MIMHGLKTGHRLQGGKYRIERVLGQGSFGITYLAKGQFVTEGPLGKMQVEAQVAIKEFFMSEVNSRHGDGSSVEGSSGSVFTNYRRRFKKEAVNLSKLEHPGIVKVFDVFDENNTTYYVMEFIEGTNLDEYIAQRGSLPEKEAIDITSKLGEALQYMHSQKMLHLDLKPRNVMRKPDGSLYLIDFGLSKQFSESGEPESSTSIGLGTPGYAPIEQSSYRQDGAFPATLDVYALGATLFKMLTGQRPPDATHILNDPFPDKELTNKKVTKKTQDCLMKAMAPMRKYRFQSVSGFTAELSNVVIPIELAKKPKPVNDATIVSAQTVGLQTVRLGKWPAEPTKKIAEPTKKIKKDRGEINGHEWIDLGLPSGLKWATNNVGAKEHLTPGLYYSWGEIEDKKLYTEKSYQHTYLRKFTEKKCFGLLRVSRKRLTCKMLGNDISGEKTLDVAAAKWGGSWRMPRVAEWEELMNCCKWVETISEGIRYYCVTGPNGNSLIFVCGGYKELDETDEEVNFEISDGFYWSASRRKGMREWEALGISFGDYIYRAEIRELERSYGCLIRPVSD